MGTVTRTASIVWINRAGDHAIFETVMETGGLTFSYFDPAEFLDGRWEHIEEDMDLPDDVLAQLLLMRMVEMEDY